MTRQPHVPAFDSSPRVWLIDPAGRETFGWFLITPRKDGRPMPASILREPSERDPEWLRPIYRLLGFITDRRTFEARAGRAIAQAQHDHLVKDWDWGKRNQPAAYDPTKPYDLGTQPSVF